MSRIPCAFWYATNLSHPSSLAISVWFILEMFPVVATRLRHFADQTLVRSLCPHFVLSHQGCKHWEHRAYLVLISKREFFKLGQFEHAISRCDWRFIGFGECKLYSCVHKPMPHRKLRYVLTFFSFDWSHLVLALWHCKERVHECQIVLPK